VSTPPWFPRSPLSIPFLASTLGRLSRRWFKPPESPVRPCSHEPEKARTSERRRSALLCLDPWRKRKSPPMICVLHLLWKTP
jgi:hypothetical protein